MKKYIRVRENKGARQTEYYITFVEGGERASIIRTFWDKKEALKVAEKLIIENHKEIEQ